MFFTPKINLTRHGTGSAVLFKSSFMQKPCGTILDRKVCSRPRTLRSLRPLRATVELRNDLYLFIVIRAGDAPEVQIVAKICHGRISQRFVPLHRYFATVALRNDLCLFIVVRARDAQEVQVVAKFYHVIVTRASDAQEVQIVAILCPKHSENPRKNPPQHLPKSIPKPPKIEPKTLQNRGLEGVR